VRCQLKEAELSQRGRAIFHVVENVAVIQSNSTSFESTPLSSY